MDDAFLGNNQQGFQLNQNLNISTVKQNGRQLENNNNIINGFQGDINPNVNNHLNNAHNGQYLCEGNNDKHKKDENAHNTSDKIKITILVR